MSEQNEQVVRRGIDELWNGGRTEIIPEITGPGYVRHNPPCPTLPTGPMGSSSLWRSYETRFPI